MIPGPADAMKAYREFLRNGGKVPEALQLLMDTVYMAAQSDLVDKWHKEGKCPVCGKEK